MFGTGVTIGDGAQGDPAGAAGRGGALYRDGVADVRCQRHAGDEWQQLHAFLHGSDTQIRSRREELPGMRQTGRAAGTKDRQAGSLSLPCGTDGLCGSDFIEWRIHRQLHRRAGSDDRGGRRGVPPEGDRIRHRSGRVHCRGQSDQSSAQGRGGAVGAVPF